MRRRPELGRPRPRAADDSEQESPEASSGPTAGSVVARLRGVAHRRPIARAMADVMTEYIPLDETRRAEYRVARAFAGRAVDAPALAEVDAETARALREDIARAVHNGKECGEVDEHLDPQPAAVRLAAVMEGLALQVYREPEGGAGAPVARAASRIRSASR